MEGKKLSDNSDVMATLNTDSSKNKEAMDFTPYLAFY